MISLSFDPSLTIEELQSRSKRTSVTEEFPLKQIHIDIFNILENQSSPIALQELFEYDFIEKLPTFPNYRITKSDLSKH